MAGVEIRYIYLYKRAFTFYCKYEKLFVKDQAKDLISLSIQGGDLVTQDQFLELERVPFECRKTKTKEITLANHEGPSQSSGPMKTGRNYT